jgi:hypothetical protein
MQPKFETRDDAEFAAAATERPEQIGLMIMIDDSWCAIGSDDLEP